MNFTDPVNSSELEEDRNSEYLKQHLTSQIRLLVTHSVIILLCTCALVGVLTVQAQCNQALL